MHSRPIAEPLSIIAGVVTGVIATNVTRSVVKWALQGEPEWLSESAAGVAAVVAGGLTHYAANQAVDAAVSAGMLDPVGGAAGTISSPTEAAIHTAIAGLAEVVNIGDNLA